MRALLIVSADQEADLRGLSREEAPRRDYIELARLLRADVFDVGAAARTWLGRRSMRLPGRSALQALLAGPRLRDYDVVFSDNERVGVFVALLLRLRQPRPRHVILAHHLTPLKKRPLLRLARQTIDTLIVHTPAQKTMAERLGFQREHVVVLPYQVDTQFWQPSPDEAMDPMICSAGLECRDYETLLGAVSGQPVEVHIGAASNWSRKQNRLRGQEAPKSVTVRSYSYTELRDLYARSRFVVVPLVETDFQAGITLILEAMAMAKPVIVSRTLGQRDVVRGPLWQNGSNGSWPEDGPAIDASTGIYVRPGDPVSLRAAINYLLEHPDVAAALGRNGRLLAEREYTLEAFSQRFAAVIEARSLSEEPADGA